MKEIKVKNKKADGFQKYLDSKIDRLVSHTSRKERSVWGVSFGLLEMLNVKDGF